MKNLLRLEELAQLALGIAALAYLPFEFSWWIWVLLFLSPDISMIGYIINTRIGAVTYNIFHHKATAIAVGLAGYLMGDELLMFAGSLLFAHSSFDRLLGYGLKYGDHFKHTHLSN